MLLSQILSILDAEIYSKSGLTDVNIAHLLTDSRQLHTEPATTLFFGIKTQKDDGGKYVPELLNKGVAAFVINRSSLSSIITDLDDKFANCRYTILLVDDALRALQRLAAYKREHYKGQVIGITGSNGKTILKEALYELLKTDYRVIRSPKSYNSQIGVPLSVWQLPDASSSDRDIAIFEVGISQPGEMDNLEPIVRPTIGILTNIGVEHSENFSSLAQKRQEKEKLFIHCPHVFEDTYHQNIRICEAVMRHLGYSDDVIYHRIFTQTHETKLYINLAALVGNLRYFRTFLAPTTRLVCLVKAFAYGVGSVEVARALQEAKIDNLPMVQYLAVAVADEGVELRKAGITLPIIVLTPELSALNQIIDNNLEPSIYSSDILQSFQERLAQKGITDYPVHIKIDSGMHRLGFYNENLPSLVVDLLKKTHAGTIVRVKSVFSHLACADDAEFDDFTMRQIAYFERAYSILSQGLAYTFHKHICNSAGIERFPQYAQDMCRLGIGMYGFSAIGAKLNNVCTLKTTIVSVKQVKKGEFIGYGCKTLLDRDSKIAVIPIGYADGLDRRLSNHKGHVLVRNILCPIVGNICMDQAMIDITDTDAVVGDQVTIFGDKLPITDLAKQLQTIPYEILTSISRRVKRDYYYA